MGIEMTDGTLADAGDGTAAFKGVAVSDPTCIGMDVYKLAISEDGLTLSGTAVRSRGQPLRIALGMLMGCYARGERLGPGKNLLVSR